MPNNIDYENTDYEDLVALLSLIREEAAERNEPMGRSDTIALQRIRALLNIPKFGLPIKPEYGES